jgi:hypothetical protein
MNIVFVTTNSRNSGIHRGLDAARLVGGKHIDCSHANRYKEQFRLANVVVHVKFACHAAFVLSNATHIYDRVDSVRKVNMTLFASEIVSCKQAAATSCRASRCYVVPHHINLNCRIHSDVNMNDTRIGYVGQNIQIPNELKSQLSKYRLTYERMFKSSCQFFDGINLAIAWRKPNIFLPQERFTNPIYFNIPTIGTSYHPSFLELDDKRHFLCTNSTCVRYKIELIRKGQLKDEFAYLRRRVMHYVSPANVRKMYMYAFEKSV